jgi:peroxiredoxin
MKKYKNLIIWATALILIFTAAYVVYGKFKSQIIMQPPVPNTLAESGNGSKNTQKDLTDGQSENTVDTTADSSTASGNADGNAGTADSDVIMVPDFTLKDLDGKEVSLSDYRGKIVVLNFWAVWCKYCVEEMPDFNKLDKELAEAGDAVVLAVNVAEPYDTVKDFLTKNDIGIKVLLDEDGGVAGGIFGVSGYPTTFVVNKDGSLYTYIPGKTDLETMRIVMDMVRNNAPLY